LNAGFRTINSYFFAFRKRNVTVANSGQIEPLKNNCISDAAKGQRNRNH